VSRDEGLGFLGSGVRLDTAEKLSVTFPLAELVSTEDMLEELMSGLIRKFTDDYLRVRGGGAGGAAGGVGGEIENVSHRFHPSARFFAANSQ
jgi:hypothetical protein